MHEAVEHVSQENTSIYWQYIEYCAFPRELRDDELKTNQDFADKFNISLRTLMEWRKLTPFWDNVKECYEKGKQFRLNAVRGSLLKTAIKGDTAAIKLYLQYEEAWNEKIEYKLSGGVNITDYLKARKSINGDNGNKENT